MCWYDIIFTIAIQLNGLENTLYVLNIDITPPKLQCPDDFSVPMKDDQNYAVVRIFPAPNVTG